MASCLGGGGGGGGVDEQFVLSVWLQYCTWRDSSSTYLARPLMIVRGSSSPTSMVSTYKLQVSMTMTTTAMIATAGDGVRLQ